MATYLVRVRRVLTTTVRVAISADGPTDDEIMEAADRTPLEGWDIEEDEYICQWKEAG